MRCRTILALVALAALQACTIAYNDLRGKIGGMATPAKDCIINYFLIFSSGHYTNTFGAQETREDRAGKIRRGYIRDTQTALAEIGCKATNVSDPAEATLEIVVERLPHISALPQEWLTGLSLGVIPSWGTRPSEYRYSFKDKRSGKSHTYAVDTKSFNHLALFPFFWITFLTANESGVYKNAVTNFMEHSQPGTGADRK